MVDIGNLVFSIIAEDKASVTVGDAAAKIGAAGMAVGAGITAVGAAATTLIDNNRAMDASFRTTALSMGVPAEAVKELARSLQSVDSPIEEVAATLDLLGRAGMTNVESMGQTASAFDTLADATGENADAMTDAMIPAFNALGVSLDEAPAQVDGLATMFRESNVDLSDFSTLMTKVGPDLGAMGASMTDVEAIMMSFADRGIQGREATSQFTDAVKNSGGSMDGLYAALGMTAGEIATYTTKLGESKGAAQEFADAQNSAFGTIDKLKFTLTEVGQGLGDLLTPFEGIATAALGIGPAITGASGALSLMGNTTVQNLVPGLKTVVTSLNGPGGLGGALTGLLPKITGSGGLLTSLTGGGGLSGALSKIVPMIGGFGTSLLALLGPLALPVAAIAAIGAAVLLLDSQFHFIGPTIDWFKGAIGALGDWLGDTFGPIIDGIIGFFGELSTSLEGSGDVVKDVMGWFGQLGESAMALAGQIGSVLGPAIQGFATWFGEVFGPAIKIGLGVLQDFAGFLVDRFIANLQSTYDLFKYIWDAAGGFFESISGGRSVIDVLATGFGIMWQAIQDAWTTLENFATWLSATFAPIIQPAMDAIGWVAEKLGLAGSNSATAAPQIAGAGTAIATAGTQANTADEPLKRYGDHVKTAGDNAGTAAGPIKTVGDNAAASGSQAAGAAPGHTANATGIQKEADAANNLGAGYVAAAKGLSEYEKQRQQGGVVSPGEDPAAAGAMPDRENYDPGPAGDSAYWRDFAIWQEKYSHSVGPDGKPIAKPATPPLSPTTPAPPGWNPNPVIGPGTGNPGPGEDSGKVSTPDPAGVVVKQWRQGDWMATQFGDGHITYAYAPAPDTPGARGKVPKFHDGGTFDSGVGEGPAILRDGETVVPPGQYAGLFARLDRLVSTLEKGSGGGRSVAVTVQNLAVRTEDDVRKIADQLAELLVDDNYRAGIRTGS